MKEARRTSTHAREIISLRQRYAEVIARHSGRNIAGVQEDIERDHFMDAREAKSYGLIDDILRSRIRYDGYLPDPPSKRTNGTDT